MGFQERVHRAFLLGSTPSCKGFIHGSVDFGFPVAADWDKWAEHFGQTSFDHPSLDQV